MTTTREDIEKILKRMKENTRTENIRIKTKLSSQRLPLTCSKLGGFPYWPKDRGDYPKTKTGIPLTMLAQINLSDLPENDVFPNKGLLQFFIWNSLDWDNCAVVYHKDLDTPPSPYISTLPTSLMPEETEITNESGERVTVPNIFWDGKGFPVTGELELEFSKGCDFVNPTENCFETEFKKAARQTDFPIPDDFDVFSDLPSEVYDEFYSFGGGHKLLGRPCFVQYDYREDEDDILLLQIDSAWSETGETDRNNFINLGDAGTAGFFIKKENLEKLDFSNIVYDWQCY